MVTQMLKTQVWKTTSINRINQHDYTVIQTKHINRYVTKGTHLPSLTVTTIRYKNIQTNTKYPPSDATKN